MFPLQFSLSRENFGNNRIRTEDIHESPLRKLVFIEQLSNKVDTSECWHLDMLCFPVFDHVTQQAQVVVFGMTATRLC